MAIEDLDLFLKGQSFHNLDMDFVPSRCGSAPPSMGGSRTAVESIFKRKSTLNPRLFYQNISTKHFVYSKSSLPVQEEELEEDLSSEQSFLQEDSFKTSSLSHDLSQHKSSEKSVVPNAESRCYKKESTGPQNNLLQEQAASHVASTLHHQRSYTQIIYPGINHAYGSFNQFHYNSSIASTSVQPPLLHSSVFSHPLYAAAANASSPYYPNLHTPGFFPSQYGMSGYTFNYPGVPVYMAGNPYRTVPVVLNSNSIPISRISNGGNLHGQIMPLPYINSPSGYNNLNTGQGHVSSHYSFSNGGSPGATVANNQCDNRMNIYSLLEDLKTGKGQRLELYNISGYIREFSVDQHGSRFIQQRLETCSVEEKASVLKEVVPHASQLMTDVFGNYVIQKLFEYGTAEQRKDLANQLQGQVVPLTLHMYGCRVIQKALEFIDLEQKTRLVRELNGQVMRCVHDQNGNHVIQKCIEKIPSCNINFIISSFRGQVATLSMHPYGCRVIQRVLEHCKDELQTQFIVDEILDSVSSLAQDQYGNYVLQVIRGKLHQNSSTLNQMCYLPPLREDFLHSITKMSLCESQFELFVMEWMESSEGANCNLHENVRTSFAKIHVLERSKAHERKEIIEKLCNSIVQLSQNKFASNVIEKCLEYSDSSARDMLIEQIIGHGDKNDNLWTMMKDQYANYVVQKILQICTTDQRKLLLGLIRDHLTPLRKYTHGKHIAIRFEELYEEETDS